MRKRSARHPPPTITDQPTDNNEATVDAGKSVKNDAIATNEVLVQRTGKRLQAIMADMNISMNDLAALLGTSPSRLANWVYGYHLPPVPYALLLAKVAGVTLDWIYSGNELGIPVAAYIRLTAAMSGVELSPSASEIASKLKPKKENPDCPLFQMSAYDVAATASARRTPLPPKAQAKATTKAATREKVSAIPPSKILGKR